MSVTIGQQLPPSWVRAELSAIAQINPPLDRCILSDNVLVDFIPMRAVEPEGGGILRPEASTYGEVKKGYTAFLAGDVIMAKITPCMENGKTCVVPELPGAACFGSTEFHVVRTEGNIAARWISNFLLQHSTRHAALRQMMGGVGQMRVPSVFLESLIIPIPPDPEQQRILDALDELLSDLDAGVAALERVQAKLKHYRAAVLKAAVEGTLVPSQQPYPVRKIGEAIESLGQGWSPKCESEPSADRDTERVNDFETAQCGI
jgi:type I restriction enzyme S subunit